MGLSGCGISATARFLGVRGRASVCGGPDQQGGPGRGGRGRGEGARGEGDADGRTDLQRVARGGELRGRHRGIVAPRTRGKLGVCGGKRDDVRVAGQVAVVSENRTSGWMDGDFF
jgi:hypothetical protein